MLSSYDIVELLHLLCEVLICLKRPKLATNVVEFSAFFPLVFFIRQQVIVVGFKLNSLASVLWEQIVPTNRFQSNEIRQNFKL